MRLGGDFLKYSFLVPVYNADEKIRECLTSIVKQTYRDFEIVLYDDGSTDKSGEICDDFISKYPDLVRVAHGTENVGIFSSRIQLMKLAKGEVFIFIDADDEIKTNLLEEVDDKFRIYDCDVVIYEFEAEYDFRFGLKKLQRMSNWQDDRVFVLDNKNELYEMVAAGNMNSIWRKAFKRCLFDLSLDYEQFKNVMTAEDLLLTLPIITMADKVVYIHKSLYFYKINHKSITHVFNIGKFDSKITVLNELMKYMKRWNLPEDRWCMDRMILDTCDVFIRTMAGRTCCYDKKQRIEIYHMIVQKEICMEAFRNLENYSVIVNDLFNKRFSRIEHMLSVMRIREYWKSIVSRIILE